MLARNFAAPSRSSTNDTFACIIVVTNRPSGNDVAKLHFKITFHFERLNLDTRDQLL